jgi:hypothetical protein
MLEHWNDANNPLHPVSAPDYLPTAQLQKTQLHRLQMIVERAYHNVAPFPGILSRGALERPGPRVRPLHFHSVTADVYHSSRPSSRIRHSSVSAVARTKPRGPGARRGSQILSHYGAQVNAASAGMRKN